MSASEYGHVAQGINHHPRGKQVVVSCSAGCLSGAAEHSQIVIGETFGDLAVQHGAYVVVCLHVVYQQVERSTNSRALSDSELLPAKGHLVSGRP